MNDTLVTPTCTRCGGGTLGQQFGRGRAVALVLLAGPPRDFYKRTPADLLRSPPPLPSPLPGKFDRNIKQQLMIRLG